MNLKLVTGPASEPISLAQAKSWARIEHTIDDDLITEMITEAREYIEDFTGLALVTQVWEAVLDELPSVLKLQKSPLVSVSGIYYTDQGGTETQESTDNYIVDTLSDRIILKEDRTWDGNEFARLYNGWRIRFTAGESAYPNWAKNLTRRLVAYRYENRGSSISPDIEAELRSHRKTWL